MQGNPSGMCSSIFTEANGELVNGNRSERIRERAHQIWEREGRPEGRELEHWRQAEQEIADELRQSPDTEPDAAGRGAAREYDKATRDFSQRGKVESKAQEATNAIESGEADSLREAEKAGKERKR
jgi:Protein of unknown function (DUF2934)